MHTLTCLDKVCGPFSHDQVTIVMQLQQQYDKIVQHWNRIGQNFLLLVQKQV